MEDRDVLRYIAGNDGAADVFDLLYETGLPYETLKSILDGYVSDGSLRTEDGRQYAFTGNEAPDVEDPPPDGEEPPPDGEEPDWKRAGKKFFEARRRDFFERVRAAADAGKKKTISMQAIAEEDAVLAKRMALSRWGIRKPTVEKRAQRSLAELLIPLCESTRGSISFRKDGEKFIISVDGYSLSNGTDEFAVYCEDADLYVGDMGAALSGYSDPFDPDQLTEIIRTANEWGAELNKRELRVLITAPDKTLAALMRLCCLADRFLRIPL